jgi:hypothetical protein
MENARFLPRINHAGHQVVGSDLKMRMDRTGRSMPTAFPSPYDAPAKLLAVDGHCGLLAAWCVIRYYHRRTSTDQLIRMCGYTRRYGVSTVGLAVALSEHGLDVTFHTEPDLAMKGLERRFYQRARDLQIPVLPPVSLRELVAHTAAGHIPIVLHETTRGQAHFSPLLGQRRGRLLLPHSDGGSMSRGQFIKRWRAPEILQQCVIVKGPSSQRVARAEMASLK